MEAIKRDHVFDDEKFRSGGGRGAVHRSPSECYPGCAVFPSQLFQSNVIQGTPCTSLPPCAQESPIRAILLPSILAIEDPPVILSDVVGTPVQSRLSPIVATGTPSTVTKFCCVETTGPPICGRGPGSIIGQTCQCAFNVTGIPGKVNLLSLSRKS